MARTKANIDIPDLRGRLALVTGASDGLGVEIARRLALAGAEVILPARKPKKGAAAVGRIAAEAPDSVVSTRALDLASLRSVHEPGEVLLGEGRPGHARMTTMSSLGTRDGKIDFDDLQSSNNYKPWPAYNQSKLALTLFAREFAHRTAAQRWVVMSNVAHPGLTVTNLQGSGPNLGRSSRSAMSWTFPWLGRGGARHLAGGYERVLVLAPLLQGHGGIPSVTKDVQTLQRSAARN